MGSEPFTTHTFLSIFQRTTLVIELLAPEFNVQVNFFKLPAEVDNHLETHF